jgi:hypothetical protein
LPPTLKGCESVNVTVKFFVSGDIGLTGQCHHVISLGSSSPGLGGGGAFGKAIGGLFGILAWATLENSPV